MREGNAHTDERGMFGGSLDAAPRLAAVSFERIAATPSTDLLRIVVAGHDAERAPDGALVTATSRGVHLLDPLPPHRVQSGDADVRWRLAFQLPAGLAGEDAIFTLRIGDQLVSLRSPRRVDAAEATGERHVVLPAPPAPAEGPEASVTLLASMSAVLAHVQRSRDDAQRALQHAQNSLWEVEQRHVEESASRLPARRGPAQVARASAALAAVALAIIAAGLAEEAGVSTSGASSDRLGLTPKGSGPIAVAGATRAVNEIPAHFLALYQRAARRYGLQWQVLAAVGKVEANHGRMRHQISTAGAIGPAQFLPATWQRYGMDADGDGRISVDSAADSVFAMAGYLRASGAPDDWHRALFAYNHSSAYVAQVLGVARHYGAVGLPSS